MFLAACSVLAWYETLLPLPSSEFKLFTTPISELILSIAVWVFASISILYLPFSTSADILINVSTSLIVCKTSSLLDLTFNSLLLVDLIVSMKT